MSMTTKEQPGGAIVVVAKCPIPGKSKTRLVPLLGQEGSARFAEALLSDVLLSCSSLEHSVLKVLLYAPGNAQGLDIMMKLLQYLNLHEQWVLLPVSSSMDLLSSSIGDMLTNSLERTRALLQNHHGSHGSVVFLGMDSPELPLEEIVTALRNSSEAFLCPADDGGYGMLSLPPHAPCATVFQDISWSQSLTAVSQLKALTDCGINVKLGRLMHDMDEPDDVQALAERLCRARSQPSSSMEESNDNVLLRSSSVALSMPPMTGLCERTWNILLSLGLIVQHDGGMYEIRQEAFSK